MANQQVAERQKRLGKMTEKGQAIVYQQSELLMQYGIRPQAFANALHNAIIATPALAECFPDQVYRALRHSIRDGITPDGREGVLVPVGMKDAEGKWLPGKPGCAYFPMREGLARAFCSATGAKLKFGAVRENDEYRLELGLKPDISHTPKLGQDRGDVLFTYCYHKLPNGDEDMSIMDLEEIEQAKKASRASSGPWVTWFERMAIKSVIKRHVNANRHLIPKDQSGRFESLIDGDEEHADDVTVIEGEDMDFTPLGAGTADRQGDIIEGTATEKKAPPEKAQPEEKKPPAKKKAAAKRKTSTRKKAPAKKEAVREQAKTEARELGERARAAAKEPTGEGAQQNREPDPDAGDMPGLPGFDDDFGEI